MSAEVSSHAEGWHTVEEAQRRSLFLVRASAVLSESLDYEQTLRRVAELAVPDIADWCTVTAVDEYGMFRRLAVVHLDETKKDLVAEYETQFPPAEHRMGVLLDVLERGKASLSARVTDEDLVRAAQTEGHLRVLRGLGCSSCILVPMVVRGEVLGVISLMRVDPRPPFGQPEVAIAEELAHRAALAVDSARLYRKARRGEDTMRFFAEASVVLSSSLDVESICQRLAQLVVPSFADWCGVDLHEEGELRSVAIAHVDPAKVEFARELRRRYPPDSTLPSGSYNVIRTGQSELYPELTDEMLVRSASDDDHLRFIRELGLRSVMIVPLVASGRPLGVLSLVWAESGHVYDADDLRMMEELGRRAGLAVENARLYDEARAAVRLRDDFLSIASHELRTPLTTLQLQVSGMCRTLSKSEGSVEIGKLRSRVEMVDKQLARLTQLVDALLDVSRATAGRLELSLGDVELGQVVREVADRFKDDLAAARSELTVEIEGEIHGRWDRLRLDEVVTNFLSNAVKYGAGKPIEIRARATEATAVIEVRDHGIGISPGDQQRLFKRFSRVISPEHYGGFGLGLWIVKVLIEAMGGFVHVESAVDVGSVFSATLPRNMQQDEKKT